MAKSPDAFRTISEVAEWLDKPAHVLRFWESKFTQVKPVKRAGGRRYYRPDDMLLLGGIKKLLHDDGMTIKGVQKILREQGVKYVASLSQPLDEISQATGTHDTIDATPTPAPPVSDPAPTPPEPADQPVSARDSDDETGQQDIDAKPDEGPDEPAPAPEEVDTTEPDTWDDGTALPAFLRMSQARAQAPDKGTEETSQDGEPDADEPDAEPAAPAIEQLDLPEVPPLDQIDATPGVISAALARRLPLDAAARAKLSAARDDLARLRTRLAQNAKE